MKRTILASLILFSLTFTLYGEEISLEDYVSMVQNNNKDLKIAAKNTEKAQTVVKQAFASFFPVIGAGAGYTHSMNSLSLADSYVQSNPMLASFYPSLKDSFEDSSLNAGTVEIGSVFNIYNPQTIGAYKTSRKTFEIEKAGEEYLKKYVTVNAKKLYAQVQLLTSVYEVEKEMTQMYKEVYEAEVKKYNAGTITELDMRMSEVDWKNSELSLISAEKNLNAGLSVFKHLACIDENSTVTLSSSKDEVNAFKAIDENEALSKRTDYKIILLSKDMADLQLKNAYSEFSPTIIGGAAYVLGKSGGSSDRTDFFDFGNTDFHNLTFSVQAIIPLYTGGLRRGLVKEAKANQELSSLTVDKTKDSISQELTELKFRVEEVSARLEAARVIEETSQRALELARTSLDSGLGTQVNLSQAESKLSQAKLNYKNAIYEYKACEYDLDFALGE